MNQTYRKGEKFFSVSFDLPNIYLPEFVRKGKSKSEVIANAVRKLLPNSVNIRVIPCEVIYEPSKLSIVKENSSCVVYNVKHVGDA